MKKNEILKRKILHCLKNAKDKKKFESKTQLILKKFRAKALLNSYTKKWIYLTKFNSLRKICMKNCLTNLKNHQKFLMFHALNSLYLNKENSFINQNIKKHEVIFFVNYLKLMKLRIQISNTINHQKIYLLRKI